MKRIKKIILSALLTLAALPLGASAAANASYTDFTDGSPWTLVEGASVKDGVLELSPNDVFQGLTVPSPYPAGMVVMEYEFKANGDSNDIFIQNYNGDSVCRIEQRAKNVVFWYGDYEKSANSSVIFTDFDVNKQYHIKHVINFVGADAGVAGTTSSVYIYDEQGVLFGSKENVPYMNCWKNASPDHFSSALFRSRKANKANGQFDNIAIYEATTESVLAINKSAVASIPDADAISDNIDLKTTGYYGTAISWQSSNPEVIANDGTVTAGAATVKVDLTATITYGGETETVVVPVTVLPYVVKADIYSFDFNDNVVPTGLDCRPETGYAGVRNKRVEIEKPDGVDVTKNPYAAIRLDKMEYGRFSGKFIIEYDFVSTGDKTLLGYVQADPNGGSLVRIEQYNITYLSIYTGGDGEAAANKSTLIAFTPGKEYHAKIAVDYDKNRCSVYIDGEAIAENHHFMTSTSPGYLQTLLFQHSGKYGAMAVDNLVMYHTDDDSSIVATQAMLDIENTEITEDITLPTEGYNGTTITWASDWEDLLTNDGKLLYNPTFKSDFELTATILKNGFSLNKKFSVTIPKITAPNTATVSDAVITNDFFGNITALKAGYPAKAKVNVTKPANSELSLTLIVALYDKEGTLKSVKWTDKTLNTVRATDSISLEITDTADADDYVVLYVWDSILGMTPVKTAQTIEIE